MSLLTLLMNGNDFCQLTKETAFLKDFQILKSETNQVGKNIMCGKTEGL